MLFHAREDRWVFIENGKRIHFVAFATRDASIVGLALREELPFRRSEASLKPWIRFAEVVCRSGHAERVDQGFCEADPTGERFGECTDGAQVLVEGNRDGSL
jgi:hypothetical protein